MYNYRNIIFYYYK